MAGVLRSSLKLRSSVSRGGRRAFAHTPLNFPKARGEPLLDYRPGSDERAKLKDALQRIQSECPEIPCVIGGEEVRTGNVKTQVMPTKHAHTLCKYHQADESVVQDAIKASLSAKKDWENMPFDDRAAIYFKAADLLSTKYRADVCAAVMLGTGKNAWQAEIDAAVETIDFLRFAPEFAKTIYDMQPLLNSPGVWNRQVHRPLEGFVAGISTCNFAAIGVNLVPTPALMGNVTLRKPAATAILGNYNMALKILEEAGMPPGVVNFLPSTGQVFGGTALSHPELAGVHFTGSTCTLEHIWKKIGENLQSYRSYRRLVGETGGINFQFVHPSADVENVVNQTLRSAFEYLGQKCSACSRAYVPASLWSEIQPKLCRSVSEIRTGQPDDFEAFMTAVINKKSFDTAKSYIDWAKSDSSCDILAGGECDDSEGYFVQPTVVVTTDPKCIIISEEVFAPVLTKQKTSGEVCPKIETTSDGIFCAMRVFNGTIILIKIRFLKKK
eukprot:857136_1